jgi:hypothetical protein
MAVDVNVAFEIDDTLVEQVGFPDRASTLR